MNKALLNGEKPRTDLMQYSCYTQENIESDYFVLKTKDTLVINPPVNHKRGQIYEAHDGSGRTDGMK